MDGSRFDELARLLAENRTRRGIAKSMAAAALVAAGLGRFSAAAKDDKEDKNHKNDDDHRHDNHDECAVDGKSCRKDKECCSGHCCAGTCQDCCADRDCPAPKNRCKKAVCSSGQCSVVDAVVCSASDQCHVAGACNPATGKCSNPKAPNGAPCDDGNACTRSDTCQKGTCVGGDAVVCGAPDGCRGTGTCDPATGKCSYPDLPDGTACGDGDSCSGEETCLGGVCQGGTPLECTTDNPCLTASCDPAKGCVLTPKGAGTACGDDDACNGKEMCDGEGHCQPGEAVACDPCLRCNRDDGTCEPDPDQNGKTCPGEGNLCFGGFRCRDGACAGVDEVRCAPLDDCHVAGICQPGKGACTNPNAPDGTSCPAGPNQTGTCTAGQCQAVCNPGYADCDAQAGTGCETAILTDPQNCGTCGHTCTASETCVGGVCTGTGGGTDAICKAATDGCATGATLCDDGLGEPCNCFTTTEGDSRCSSLRAFTSCDNGCASSADCPGTPHPDGNGRFGPNAFCARVDGCCDVGVNVCLDPCPNFCTVTCACPYACFGDTCIGPGPQETGTLTADDPTFARCQGFGPGYLYHASTFDHAGGNLAINLRGSPSGGGTIDDTYLALYTGFDPADPCANLVAEKDDNECSLEARLVKSIPAGTYTVVATTFRPGFQGDFTLEFNRCSPCGA